MNHPLRCLCGALKGHVSHPEAVSRGVCYCKDCQAYARFLGRAGDILDAMGGSDVLATVSKHVTISEGKDVLACMSLSEKGMLRWYASCCKTPVANTSRDFKFPHVGLLHNCLEGAGVNLDSVFGPVTMRVNRKGATSGKPEAMPVSTVKSVVRHMKSVVRARVDGSYRTTPFFDPRDGSPVVAPYVLSTEPA